MESHSVLGLDVGAGQLNSARVYEGVQAGVSVHATLQQVLCELAVIPIKRSLGGGEKGQACEGSTKKIPALYTFQIGNQSKHAERSHRHLVDCWFPVPVGLVGRPIEWMDNLFTEIDKYIFQF